MSSADDIQAMLDDIYGVAGIPCRWTPAGGAAVDFTGLVGGGDEAAAFQGFTGAVNIAVRTIKARSAELLALAPGVTKPLQGDRIDLLDATGAVTASVVINGDPRQADPRRLEWTLSLGDL